MAELLQVDYEMHRMTRDPLNLALRRYAGMTLTNLTFGDVANKVPGAAGGGQGPCPPRPRPSLEIVLRGGDSCPQLRAEAQEVVSGRDQPGPRPWALP